MSTDIKLDVNNVDDNRWHPLKLFLSSWLEDVCDSEYTIVEQNDTQYNITYSIHFDSDADATIVKLTDIPENYSKYIKIS